ncbi:MAG: hypothetical protein ACOCQ4_00555 [bacterium]
MDLRTIFDLYCDKMAQIQLYQRAMKKLAKNELEEINEYEKVIKNNPELKDYSHSHHRMTFRKAENGKHISFARKKLSIKDRRLSVVLHKNKQYQWLLSESYEEFKDCLEYLYAYAGYIDNNFWPLKDFGNISLNEVTSKPFEWFKNQASKKKDTTSSIINKFRNTYDDIQTIETNNTLEVNLYLAVTLVEFLRHIIVHKGGVVHNKNEFKKRVLEKCGLYNNGRPLEAHTNFIDAFFGEGEYENTIALLEIPIYQKIPLDFYINRFEVLSGYLMTYIYKIYECLEQSYKKNNSDNAKNGASD